MHRAIRIFTQSSFWFWGLMATLPFSTGLFLGQPIPGTWYHDVFIYASDIFLVGFIVSTFLPRWRRLRDFWFQGSRLKVLAVFGAVAFLTTLWATSPGLALYHFVRLLAAALFACAVGVLVSEEKRFLSRVLLALVIFSVIQSLIGLAQFKAQEAIGLSVLGESPISVTDPGTSKIALAGSRLLRAYGTFPHPNVLGAFLVLGLISLFYFYIRRTRARREEGWWRLLIGAGVFVLALGIALSFSRAAWLVGFLASVPFVIYTLRAERKIPKTDEVSAGRPSSFWFQNNTGPSPVPRRSSFQGLAFLVILSYTLLAILGWAIFPRIQVSGSEPAVRYRLIYNEIGATMVAAHPLGVGIGNQILYAYRNGLFRQFGLSEAWEWAPIHNLYILVAAETGVVGVASFLLFIGSVLRGLLRGRMTLETFTVTFLILSVLVLGLFDHYFWTIEQGRLMLWLVLGLGVGISFAREREKSSEPEPVVQSRRSDKSSEVGSPTPKGVGVDRAQPSLTRPSP